MADYNPVWWLIVLFVGAMFAFIPLFGKISDDLKAIRSLLESLNAKVQHHDK